MFIYRMFFALFLIAGVSYLYLGSHTLYVNKRERINRIFAWGCYSLAIWALSYAMDVLSKDYASALLWRRVSVFGWGTFYAIMFHFAIVYLRTSSVTKQVKKRINVGFILIYIPAIVTVFIYGISSTMAEHYYKLTKTQFGWKYVNQNSIWDLFFNFYYISYSIVFAVLMMLILRRTKLVREKRQVILIFVSFICCFFFGSISDILIGYFTTLELPQSAILFFLIPVFAMWYALRRYGSTEISIELISEDILIEMNEGLILLDAHQKIRYVNDYLVSLAGYSKEETLGKEPQSLFSKEEKPDYFFWSRILVDDQSGCESVLKERTGAELPVLLSGRRIVNQWGDLLGAVCILTDLSEVKQTEKELYVTKLRLEDALQDANSALELKTQFLSNMSHEIRTPMNSIIGMAYLLDQTDLNPKQKEYLNQLQKASSSLLTMVNDILDFSKLDSGDIELEQKEFDVFSVLAGVVDKFRTMAIQKQLKLSYASDDKIPQKVIGDPDRLEQILSNLLDNAVKFTNCGEIAFTVKLKEKLPEQIVLYFEIVDTGIGIDEKDLDKIFDLFTQIDGSRTRQYAGTGMGLAISRKLLLRMGTDLEVKSQIGNGSSFSFTVRLGLLEEPRLTDSLVKGEYPVFTQTAPDIISPELLKELRKLSVLLEEGDSEALDRFDVLKEQIGIMISTDDFDYLQALMSRYEFDAANQKLKELFS